MPLSLNPAYIATLVLQLITLVHAVKSGKTFPWLYVILFLPVVGSLAYILVEILPGHTDWLQFKISRPLSLKELKAAAADYPTADNLEALADAYTTQNDYRQALMLYQQAAEGVHADDAFLLRKIAESYYQLHQFPDALEEMKRIHALGEESGEDYLLRARILAALKQPTEAEQYFLEAIKHHTSLKADYYYAEFLKRIGKQDEFEQVRRTAEKKLIEYLPKFRAQEKIWLDKIKTERV